MKKFRLFLVVMIVVVVTSCISDKKRAKICATCPVVTEVVTKEKITSFDTALFISKRGKDLSFKSNDSDCCVLVNALLAAMAENNDTIVAKENGIKSSIFKDKAKGKIVFRCEADSLKEIIKGLRTEITKSKTETKVIEKTCDKKHKDWLDKYDRPVFWLVILGLVIFGLIKFGPRILKLVKFL